MNSEHVTTQWMRDDIQEALAEYPTIHRTLDEKDRYYYVKGKKSVTFYIGTTTWQHRVIPPSPFLIKYFKDNTAEEIEQRLHDTSHYGSFMHLVNGEYTQQGLFSLEDQNIQDWMKHYKYLQEQKGIYFPEETTVGWGKQIRKDILAWAQFLDDRNVEPLAVEIILLHNASEAIPFNSAGTIDLACEMDWNGKRVLAIVDMKSGGIWPDHVYQLIDYRDKWNATFPEYPVTHLFNWSPKDWDESKKPTYTLKNQTGVEDAEQEMPYWYQLAGIRLNPEPKNKTLWSGEVTRGEDLSQHYSQVTAMEYYLQED